MNPESHFRCLIGNLVFVFIRIHNCNCVTWIANMNHKPYFCVNMNPKSNFWCIVETIFQPDVLLNGPWIELKVLEPEHIDGFGEVCMF